MPQDSSSVESAAMLCFLWHRPKFESGAVDEANVLHVHTDSMMVWRTLQSEFVNVMVVSKKRFGRIVDMHEDGVAGPEQGPQGEGACRC